MGSFLWRYCLGESVNQGLTPVLIRDTTSRQYHTSFCCNNLICELITKKDEMFCFNQYLLGLRKLVV